MSVQHLLLTGGPTHEFGTTSALLVGMLADVGVASTVVEEPDAAVNQLRETLAGSQPGYQLFTVFGLHWRMAQERYADQREKFAYTLTDNDAVVVRDFVAGGGGMLALHTAVICFDAHPVWRELCGAAWNWERSSHPPVDDVAVTVTADGRRHEITADLDDFVVEDEAYRDLDIETDLVPLLTTTAGGSPAPLLWTRHVGSGRVVTNVLGHGPSSLHTPAHRAVIQRSAVWAASAMPR